MFLLGSRAHRARADGDGFAQVEKLYENLHVVNRDDVAPPRRRHARGSCPQWDRAARRLQARWRWPAALECSLEELKPLFGAWRGGGAPAI